MARGKKRFAKRKKKGVLKRHSLLLLWGLAGACAGFVWLFHDLPDLDEAKPLDSKPSISILANDGTLVARFGGLQGDTVKMRDVPQYLVAAVMAVEDRRFRSHFGIDPLGLARAMVANVLAGRWVQGGSTITQQLAKNMFLTPEKTLRRKVQEAAMALRIEQKYTKDEILLAYLNRVYFGAGAYGVDAAAKTYFNKPASRLSLFESAVLAGLLKAPSRYSPSNNPDLAVARAKTVLEAMRDAGYLDDKKAAQETKNARLSSIKPLAGDQSRYFADWVLNQAEGFIAETEGDITVKTTLDPKLQLMAESKAKTLFKSIPAEDKVSQMALITQTPDGAVRAMIGGLDYADSQFNRATQALRQPGSSFKPFVFLAALEGGRTMDELVLDAPITEGRYRPDNYDGKYFGEVTLADALALSLNTATIRLLSDTGIDRFLSVADRMSFVHKPKAELASGLGASEVNLLELTTAYAVIANGGHSVWPYAVLSIKDGRGNLLYQHTPSTGARVFDGENISALDSMLTGVTERGTGQAARLSSARAAGKTGTTQNYRDAWFVGYADKGGGQKLVTGIWMGNDDATPMKAVTGGRYPAQLWRAYMDEAVNFSIPAFVPEAADPIIPSDSEFSSMLRRWSATPSVRPQESPAYNR